MRKSLLILGTSLVMFATIGVGRASAGVDVEYGGICQISVAPTGPYTPGQTGITVTGDSFEPGLLTDVFFDTTVIANDVLVLGDGTFSAPNLTIPANATAGSDHTFSAVCDSDSGSEAEVQGVVIVAAGVTPVFVTDPTTINCSGQLTGFVEGAQGSSSVGFAVATPVSRNLATSTANAAGRATFAATLTVSSTTPAGTYTIRSTGTDGAGAAFALTTQVNLTANNCNTTVVTVGGGSVPRTGTDSGPMAAVGAGAVLAGAAFVFVSRRRRSVAVAG